MALTIVHSADWHLGKRFRLFKKEDEMRLMRARLEVIRDILGVAEEHRADAVLCAGDLFDCPQPKDTWWKGLLRLLERSEPTRPIFLLPGNHDPLTDRSVYAPIHPFRRALPRWVHVVDRDDFEHSLGEQAVLYAVPCRSRAGQNDPTGNIPERAADDPRIRIGMVHGSTFDMEGVQISHPIARDAAQRCGLDYLAIGDTHNFRFVPEGAAVPTVYPSAPEPTSFKETDAGYVAVVFFARHNRRADVQKRRVARWSWRQETIRDLASLRRLRRENLKQCVLRLTLDLVVTPEEHQELTTTLIELEGSEAAHPLVGVLLCDRSGVDLDTTDAEQLFEDLPDVVRTCAKKLREAAEQGADAAVARRALLHLYKLSKGALG